METYVGRRRRVALGAGPEPFPGKVPARYDEWGRYLGQGPEEPIPGVTPEPLRLDPEIWKEFFAYSADFAGAQALTAGTANGRPSAIPFTPFNIVIDADSHFEFVKTMYVATDPRVYVRYRDDTAGRYLHRGALDLQALAGLAAPFPTIGASPNPRAPSFVPFIWPRAHLIAAMSQFSVEAADYSGVGNTVRIAFHGAKLRPGRAPWDRPVGRRLPYTIAIPDDSVNPEVAANATVPFAVSIDKQADFVVYKVSGVRQGAALVTIQDGRDRSWFKSAQHIDNWIGNGSFPNILPAPRFVPRGSALSGTIQDLSGATNIVRMYLSGELLFD